ncbi:hypothetical protein DFJ74DRAFT_708964 [Hyaloraphidium curvatum]|nr:hypothetical protein DFJ74DRAFT_709927 [Hyaloraphidium curvatum]KAI9015640.1 hypothetical protein DFJ74DRAFT_709570 [Hyaloraphidium curvatum]KAI9016924.1 hypothetical protein DFJ74DRAFT_708964 [Hyaloraphidium curvatum]
MANFRWNEPWDRGLGADERGAVTGFVFTKVTREPGVSELVRPLEPETWLGDEAYQRWLERRAQYFPGVVFLDGQLTRFAVDISAGNPGNAYQAWRKVGVEGYVRQNMRAKGYEHGVGREEKHVRSETRFAISRRCWMFLAPLFVKERSHWIFVASMAHFFDPTAGTGRVGTFTFALDLLSRSGSRAGVLRDARGVEQVVHSILRIEGYEVAKEESYLDIDLDVGDAKQLDGSACMVFAMAHVELFASLTLEGGGPHTWGPWNAAIVQKRLEAWYKGAGIRQSEVPKYRHHLVKDIVLDII